VVAASDIETASATSSKHGAANSVDDLVRMRAVPSRIPVWAKVFDAFNAMFPGSDSWYRVATDSFSWRPYSVARMSTIGDISDPTGTVAGSAKSTWTESA
jgi:hypothetical protein